MGKKKKKGTFESLFESLLEYLGYFHHRIIAVNVFGRMTFDSESVISDCFRSVVVSLTYCDYTCINLWKKV